MDIHSKYINLSVKVLCNGKGGSGCLFQPFTTEYSYVLTAKHCLIGKDEELETLHASDIKLSINRENEFIELQAIDYYLHKDQDVAVIKIGYIKDLPSCLVSSPPIHGNVNIFGYPEILETPSTNWMGHKLGCTLNFYYRKSSLIEFIPTTDTVSYERDTAANIRGFSGSGIYLEKENDLTLIGVFTELKDEDGAYKGLLGLDIALINEILSENCLLPLIPEELLSFEKYINNAFNRNEGKIKPLLKGKAKTLLDITPNNIIEKYRNKLYLPSNSNFEGELLNPSLWEGWVCLLTYRYLESTEIPNKDNFNLLRSKDKSDNNLKMYFTKYDNLSQCIPELFLNNYDELGVGDTIVINTKGNAPGRKRINKVRTEKVLRNIGEGNLDKLIEDGIDIDNPNDLKGVEFLHIDLFLDEFSKFDEIQDITELESVLKECIVGVFNDVP